MIVYMMIFPVTQSEEFGILEFYFASTAFGKLAVQLLGKGFANH